MGSGQRQENQSSKIAILGESTSTLETLEPLILEGGFRVLVGEPRTRTNGSRETSPDLVVYDLETPNRFKWARAEISDLRSSFTGPILCLLPLTDELSPGDVADLGADDCVWKPLRPLELETRIRVLLHRIRATAGLPLVERRQAARRKGDRQRVEPVQNRMGLLIKDAAKSVILDGQELRLSPKEYELLCLLASDIGAIFSVDHIIERVWRDTARASASDVHQYMHLLRRKVEKDPTRPRWIITVKGFGYKLAFPESG